MSMRTLMRAWLPTIALLVAMQLPAAQPSQAESAPRSYVIGLSPFLDKSVKDEVYRGIIRLLVEDLPLNSSVAIYDAFDLKTITRVSLPNARVFSSPKTRANQFASAIRELK